MTRRVAGFLLLLFALCAVFAITGASAGGLSNETTPVASEPPPDAPTLSPEEALLDDAEEFSKLHGVSTDEALQRLDLQMNAIPAFENAVAAGETSRFGGLVIQNKPTYRVVVFLTSGSTADLARYISDDRLGGLVEVRRVARTYSQLKHAQMRVSRLRAVELDSDIDIPANQVNVYVASASPSEVAAKTSALRAEAARSGDSLPDWVVIKGVPALSGLYLEVFGGLNLSNTCTSGFSVTGAGGSGGVTTTAHCSNSLSYAGNALTFKTEVFGGSFDVQWHSRTNTDFPAKIYRGQGVYGPITAKKSRANQPIGATVCKRGITTDRTCGTIVSKDHQPSAIPNSTATYITATFGAASGDSGGPVWVGTEAWGHLEGPAGSNNFYMAANFIESSQNLYIRGT